VPPSSRIGDPVEVRLASGIGQRDALVLLDGQATDVSVTVEPSWHDVGIWRRSVDIINSAGTVLLADRRCADRGYLEEDIGQYDREQLVFGWSGAAVLLRGEFLADVGTFDPAYFMYYEDSDLVVRGRLRGWSYRYVPTSLVRHEHSATIGDTSRIVRHLADRNHLLLLTKVAPQSDVRRAVWGRVEDLAEAAWRDVGGRVAARRRPTTAHIRRQLRVLAGFLRLLPHGIRERRNIMGRATVDVQLVFSEAQNAAGDGLASRRAI
jgi:hypothetical protein